MDELINQVPEVELLESDSTSQHIEEVDYSHFLLDDFKKLFPKNIEASDLASQFPLMRKVKPHLEDLLERSKHEALEKFIANGGVADDFDMRIDPFFITFEQAFSKAKHAFNDKLKEQQKNKELNLKKKQEILEKMRGLIDSAGKRNVFENFKTLQQEWKNTGGVPPERSQELWSSYGALVNRFYDQRHIAFELVDLDRKKNLQLKQYLVDRAERLITEPSIKKSLKELEEVHEEFKHIGPVPKEQQEEIWLRLKAASDKIHERRHQYLEEQKSKHEAHLQAKLQILEQLQPFTTFTTDRIDEWVEKTKELDALQEQWKKAGMVDKDKVKETNRQFWDSLKKFYNNKRLFFKDIEQVKKNNLKTKIGLCEQVEALLQEEDLEKTSEQIIAIQKQWKEVGHVPIKMKDKIFERFKKACDAFFEKKRAAGKAHQEVARQQVKQKLDFIGSLESRNFSKETLESVQELLTQWNAIEAEPGLELSKAYSKLADVLRNGLKQANQISALDKEKIVSKLYATSLKTAPDGEKELLIREKRLRQEIRELENNIAQFKNNMEFFARAKNADTIRKDFLIQIEGEEQKLQLLQTRLRIMTAK